ncbi:TIGR04255 family protein [Ralstonia solanacearum]|uniref:TIGR04255 family protein n=1 Tax=Ralstonia solanacearum TaxID=305 RepID=UPI001FF7FD44|nr:TIGR04255 family protein [Ralstonia solanacearum]MDB0568082.1 TIGR04255 family protein [Ralstonia solanacearum]MDB0578116.1 TIGR04255 family protein [Ralstonia solanacearum]
MSSMWDVDSLVRVQSKNLDRYRRTFLKQAVAEFRFPTLMELGERRPPVAFVAALRKEYPTIELQNEVTLTVGGESAGSINKHIFRSRKPGWTVSLKESAFSVETNVYPGFAEMLTHVLQVVAAASKVIDSEFFTRVGLRYINVIDSGTKPEGGGWVNHDLVAPLQSHYFQGIQEYAGTVQLGTEDGGCTLQHGIRKKMPTKDQDPKDVWPDYVLDIDVFRNIVSIEDAEQVIKAMHTQAFDLFDWALGPAAREYLSSEKKPSN